jgi:Cyclic nucleotide-binding domain/FHA domain
MPRGAAEAPPASLDLPPAAPLFAEGEVSSAVYFVEAGRIELLKRQGEADSVVAVLGPGDVVGEAQALAGGRHPFSARAREASRVLVVANDALIALLSAHPSVALAMLKRLAPRLDAALLALVAAPAAPAPRFLHAESGQELPLPAGDEVRLGRADVRSQPGPALDLSALDPTRSLSRRHARIVRDGGGFAVLEEPRVANGTFLNGVRLSPGERVPLRSGDELRLGVVALSFRER